MSALMLAGMATEASTAMSNLSSWAKLFGLNGVADALKAPGADVWVFLFAFVLLGFSAASFARNHFRRRRNRQLAEQLQARLEQRQRGQNEWDAFLARMRPNPFKRPPTDDA